MKKLSEMNRVEKFLIGSIAASTIPMLIITIITRIVPEIYKPFVFPVMMLCLLVVGIVVYTSVKNRYNS